MCVMDSVHCCIVSCCSVVSQTDEGTRGNRLCSMRDIVLTCVLIFVSLLIFLSIFLSIYNLTSELVVNNDNNHHSIAIQKM